MMLMLQSHQRNYRGFYSLSVVELYKIVVQNASQLVASSPNVGQVTFSGSDSIQIPGFATPSPRMDLMGEKGTQGLCEWILEQLLHDVCVQVQQKTSVA
jgi:hypothetical protein